MILRKFEGHWLLDTGQGVDGFDNLRLCWTGSPPRETAMPADIVDRLPAPRGDDSEELAELAELAEKLTEPVEPEVPRNKTRRRQTSAGVVAGVSGRPPRRDSEAWSPATLVAARWLVNEKVANQHFSQLALAIWPEFYLASWSTADAASMAAREQLAQDLRRATLDALKLVGEEPRTFWSDLLHVAIDQVEWARLADHFLRLNDRYLPL